MGILSTIASIAAPVIGGLFSSGASSSAADAQIAAQREAIKSRERMFERGLELQAPYREAGYGALEGLQGLLDMNTRADLLSQYYGGPEYAMLSQQAEEAAIRNAQATGGARGGNTQAALATIAPALGMDFLAGRQNLLTGLGNFGVGAASQGAQSANYLGQGIAQQQSNIGDIQAQNRLTQANIFGTALGGLTGVLQGL